VPVCDNERMSSARSIRTLRGVVAAALSTFVAPLAHIAAGGSMSGVLGIVVPLVFSTLVCVLLAGRRLSILRLSLSVAVSQVMFRTLFVPASLSARGRHGTRRPDPPQQRHVASAPPVSSRTPGCSEHSRAYLIVVVFADQPSAHGHQTRCPCAGTRLEPRVRGPA
jgi:hypothetical protein